MLSNWLPSLIKESGYSLQYAARVAAVYQMGSCWMHGAGRCGALLSIFSGAQMLSLEWSANRVFMILILPALIAGIALLAKDHRGRLAAR
jgi:hypothetical protein